MKTTAEIREWLKNNPGERPNLTGANLSGADLSGADLISANLSGSNLIGADLSGADLIGADLSGSNLSKANLIGADLRWSNLSKANLIGAKLPEVIKVEKLFTKILSAIESGGVLEMGGWHKCETTHCIAGWVVTIAGLYDSEKEDSMGTSYLAALIIHKSCSYLEGKVPNFYSTNKDGMAFIKECAEKEKGMVNWMSRPGTL